MMGVFTLLLAVSVAHGAINKGVLGNDSRVISHNTKIGRLKFSTGQPGCTATLISKSCAISAGHCNNTFNAIDFNVPTDVLVGLDSSKSRDRYQIDKSSIVFQNDDLTDEDWAVFQIKKHKKISKISRWFARHFEKNSNIDKYPVDQAYYPGDMQGHYEIDYGSSFAGTLVSVIGYGTDKDPRLNSIQRSAHGILLAKKLSFSPFSLTHDVDTTPGDSGAPIINLENNKIIAVHTAFNSTRGYNLGTSINLTKRFRDAIADCLEREER